MPKPTFFNLPEDKRARITELALEEFAQRPFHRASLTRMVGRAGIAKGSVYQYFEDKLDLYRWLLTEEVPRRKAAHLAAAVAPRLPARLPASIDEFLRHAVLSGVRLMLADPRLTQLGAAIATPTDDPQLRALHAEAVETGHTQFVALLGTFVAQGQVRDDVPIPLIARVLSSVLGVGLRDIVLTELGVDLFALADDPSLAGRLNDDALERLVEDLVSVTLDGVRPRA